MAYSREQVVDEVRKIILDLGKDHDIKGAYLFGSHARGIPKEYSDIDVAVILGRFRNGGPFDERFDIFHQVQKRNSLIEVVCFTEEEFDHEDAPVVRFIKNEGIRIL